VPPDPHVPVGVQAVVERDGYRLMLRRGGTEWWQDGLGSWAHPGGWLEFGEDPLTTAVRETMEETGISVSARGLVGYSTNYNDRRSLWVLTLIVRCDYYSGEPTVMEPDKCPEVAWVPV